MEQVTGVTLHSSTTKIKSLTVALAQEKIDFLFWYKEICSIIVSYYANFYIPSTDKKEVYAKIIKGRIDEFGQAIASIERPTPKLLGNLAIQNLAIAHSTICYILDTRATKELEE